MKNNFLNSLRFLKRKHRLGVWLDKSFLFLALCDQNKILKTEQILLHETSTSLIRERVGQLIQGGPIEAILVLPRSEILQKELILAGGAGSQFKEELEAQIDRLLPCPRREMAYGISLNVKKDNAEGLILALPEKHLKEKLTFLCEVGICPDEIITEDQALLWLPGIRENESFLVVDSQKNRILFVYGSKNKLLFSRAYTRTELSEFYLDEISLVLLERDLKPGKIYLSGLWTEEIQMELGKRFNCFPEKIGTPNDFLWAESIVSFNQYPYFSLLPQVDKIKRKEAQKQKLFVQTFGSFALFFSLLLTAFVAHLQFKVFLTQKFETQLGVLIPGVQETKQIKTSLDYLKSGRVSKVNTLSFLKDLAGKLSSQVIIKEITLEADNFFFRGEVSSHASISDSVEVFSKSPFLKEVRLGETRLRKKLQQEYFEFEVNGKWAL